MYLQRQIDGNSAPCHPWCGSSTRVLECIPLEWHLSLTSSVPFVFPDVPLALPSPLLCYVSFSFPHNVQASLCPHSCQYLIIDLNPDLLLHLENHQCARQVLAAVCSDGSKSFGSCLPVHLTLAVGYLGPRTRS